MTFLRLLRSALACIVAVALSAPLTAQAQTSPCQTQRLPDDQLILVCMPPQWNGALVIYAHGYVAPQLPLALPTDEFAVSAPAVLLAQGFAYATTSFSKNGYAVAEAGQNINALVQAFKARVPPGALQHVYLVGASQGGLITAMLLERQPDVFSGGLALCGPVGGAPYQVKYQGDFRVVFDHFFDVFPFGAANVPAGAFADWDAYLAAIGGALAANPAATGQLFKVTGVARDPQRLPESSFESAAGLLFYSIWGANDLIATTGGQPFDNRFSYYRGSANDRLLNLNVERVTSDAAARAYLRQYYQTRGNLRRPLVTLHTTRDPVVPFQHELVYLSLASVSGGLRHLTVLPVKRYGHCAFTPEEVLGAFGLLILRSQGQAPAGLAAEMRLIPAPATQTQIQQLLDTPR